VNVGAALKATAKTTKPDWYADALPRAGAEYLRHVLSVNQLALYRVVTRDAQRFPELGRRYLEQTTGPREARFARYLDRWATHQKWKVREGRAAAQTFAGSLKAGLYDGALLGLREPSDADISTQPQLPSRCMLSLLRSGYL
jgi:hypothetical protein